jgi:hypothetical protein
VPLRSGFRNESFEGELKFSSGASFELNPAQAGAAATRRNQERARVLAAFFAASLRSFLDRFDALDLACRDSALGDADWRPSFLSAFIVARERLVEGLRG